MKGKIPTVRANSLSTRDSIVPILIIGFLFFTFGFISWINSILIPYFKIACQLNNFESYLVAFAFYISYLVFSLPASYLLKRAGYKRGMMIGFWIMALGAFIFIPAAFTRNYLFFLMGLFSIGAGTAVLQTAANPYITIIGPKERALQRISLMGIMNKAAGMLAPLLFAAVVLRSTDTELFRQIPLMEQAAKKAALDELARRVILPYLGMGVVLLGLSLLIRYSPLPEIEAQEEDEDSHSGSRDKKTRILQFPHLILGAIAIFLHIGTQVLSIDTIISYANSMKIGLLQAKVFPSYTLFTMIVGYILGILCIPRFLSQLKGLQICTSLGTILTLLILFVNRQVDFLGQTTGMSIWFVVLLGLPNALIWAGIWPLALEGLGKFTKSGSAILIMGLTGNAVMPLVYGYFADTYNPHSAYWVLFPCYLFLVYYAFYGYKVRRWNPFKSKAVILRSFFLTGLFALAANGRLCARHLPGAQSHRDIASYRDTSREDIVLEPYTYANHFTTRDPGAWTSYPLWQDNAYDPNFRIAQIVPGDSNLSIVAKITPYSHTDNYVGAQKLLDLYLVPNAVIRFRYFLKTAQQASFLKVRLAAGRYGKIDFTVLHPATNQWVWAKVSFHDLISQNPQLKGKGKVKIDALAFLACIPEADPAMPIYLGLDDITFKAARPAAFRFTEPAVYHLAEFPQAIPLQAYHTGDLFHLSGNWRVNAQQVKLQIVSYTDRKQILYEGILSGRQDEWKLRPLKLSFPDGLYLGILTGYKNGVKLSETEFTIHIAPRNMAGVHPRLLFNAGELSKIKERLKSEKFQPLNDSIIALSARLREATPLQSLVYDLDQFPDRNWLPTWVAFGSHIYDTGPALEWNAFAYILDGDTAAGKYAKNVLLTLSHWPGWVSPWLVRHGIYDDHRMGTWSHAVALAYDLTYPFMTPDERSLIRKAIVKNIIEGCFRTDVENNFVPSNTSNWIAHATGGALMNLAAIWGDEPETGNGKMEPQFTGILLKFHHYITHVTDTVGGAWGEGFGYNSYSLANMTFSVPSLWNVFNIDVSYPLIGTYREYIWGGLIKERNWFGFGDSEDTLTTASSWAFLLSRYKKPLLSWFYHDLNKDTASLNDLLFDTENIPQHSPFDEDPDKAFPMIGTTVFKSGWDKKDMVFVMRTGPFFNHQHLDQGSFYFADHGIKFIEDQPIHHSDYYKDPLYQSNFTQPVAHSTILINHNPQSQRVGDPLHFAQGFDDHAFIRQYLDGRTAAFSSGDIGRLYWGKVKSLTRNVLYLKPSVILMIDVAVPAEKNAAVTLLYHTQYLKDIQPGVPDSRITKDGYTLHILHLSPDSLEVKAVETPHFLNTLLNERPLIKEGMLTVTGQTKGAPLVMANLFTTTPDGGQPGVTTEKGNGFITGKISGKRFAFTTRPGQVYHPEDLQTDALAVTWSDTATFAAMATILRKQHIVLFSADFPTTVDLSTGYLHYCCEKAENLSIHSGAKPSTVILNGSPVTGFRYDARNQLVTLQVKEGEGEVIIR